MQITRLIIIIAVALIPACANDPSVTVNEDVIDAIPYCRTASQDVAQGIVFGTVLGLVGGGVSGNSLGPSAAIGAAGGAIGGAAVAGSREPCPK